jgi:hypothetical protein
MRGMKHFMNDVSLVSTGLALALLVGGCDTRAAFSYHLSPRVSADGAPLPLKVAVLPFRDMRGEKNTNAVLLYLIPLMPYGPINYDRPDAANGFLFHSAYNFRPSEDLAKAAVEELQQNQFFSEVFLTQREHEPGVDLILSGEIAEARYDGKLISYGLSVEGPLLWIFGLPAGTTHNGLVLSMELKRASGGERVWSHKISGDWGKTVGLYYNWAADFDGLPLILKEGLHEGMMRLANDLQAKPLSYWRGASD